MYYKNGTLADDRFKNLTDEQWMFHFVEIMKFRKEEVERDDIKTKLILTAINPKLGDILFKDSKTSSIEPDNELNEWYESMKEVIPKVLKEERKIRYLNLPRISKEEMRKRGFNFEITRKGDHADGDEQLDK